MASCSEGHTKHDLQTEILGQIAFPCVNQVPVSLQGVYGNPELRYFF